MTENKAAQDVIYLASCAVNEQIPDAERVAAMDLKAVYAFAKRHKISAIVAFALESAGYKDQWSTAAIISAQKKAVVFHHELMKVSKELEKAGVWYMPLKGAVLQYMYPVYGMRQMGDHDILIDADRAKDVKAIMEGLGYNIEHFGISNHDVYDKERGPRFEMHTALFGPGHDEKLYEYYKDVEKRLLGDGYEKHLGPEDFYIYLTAHEYKHYTYRGTGLRSLLDTYVYLQKTPLDMAYVTAEAEKLGMAEFEAKNRALARRLFSGGELTQDERDMLDYFLSSGVYGTMDHFIENKVEKEIAKRGYGKAGYMLARFSVPVRKKNKDYDNYANRYPFFYQHKILLPFLPFYRIFHAMKAGRFTTEAKAIKKVKV
ncbi:MAG: nucleotidyltransferase family protein [Clostridia bacterium]|nr:nucleotidyltransferase family protein [Clostridia bacterium]